MNQNYYPVDFEAQYEDTSEKMIEIATKNKDRIRTLKPAPLSQLEEQLEDLQVRIDDRELQFRKEAIYSQYASGQLMAERRKQAPEMCPECGDELKKQAQCEFCAQIFCGKCCTRKRSIPFLSKEIRLCCEQCHWKFVKLFDNKSFYEEKEKLGNVIHFVKNKVVKLNEKIALRAEDAEEFKKIKRDEKIKEKAVDGKIAQEEKKLRLIEEELRRVVSEKAERMKEEERRRQREDQEREKARRAEQERERLEELQRQMQQERIRKAKEQQEQDKLSVSQKKLQAQAEERDFMETFRRKEEELRRREEQLLRKEQQLKRQAEVQQKSAKSSTSMNHIQQQTPKQSIGNTSSDREKAIDTADSKSVNRSRRQSDNLNKEEVVLPKPAQNLVRTESTKSNAEQPPIKKLQITAEVAARNPVQEEPTDSLERSLVNMFKPKREDDARSMVSNVSKTSKSILDMSINELLAVRIPVARTPSKIEEEYKPLPSLPEQPRVQQERRSLVLGVGMGMGGGMGGVDRRSIKVEQVQEQVGEEQVRMNKDSILRNSSLITSNKQTVGEEEVGPQKCACEIM